MGVLLYQRGGHILHSSCVNISGGAVAFLGGSGYGKSTLAMAMYDQGYPVVSDDYISISFMDGVPMVTPGAPYLKLSQESIVSHDVESPDVLTRQHEIKSNFVRTQRGFSAEKIQLKGLFILEPGELLQLKELNPHDAIQSLLSNSYAINLFNDEDKIRNLKNNSLLVNTIPIYSFSIPRSLNMMGNVVNLFKKNMEGVKNPKSGY